jgi:predicted AAA+ superfamily ATPase
MLYLQEKARGDIMITRHMSELALQAATQYPVVAITGPRQSGKTTLCRELFSDYIYVNLEKPDTRQFALEDPNGFLAQFKRPVILDEVQRVPELFSYIMPLVDEHRKMGEFILSGSQNFHLQEAISQSLAGRCATLKLLPLSNREINNQQNHDIFNLNAEPLLGEHGSTSAFERIFKGGYPPVYDRNIKPTDWYAQYTQSYLERDIRSLVNVGDLETFERFLRLTAGRSGQILNMDSLASDTGVSPVTVKRWISLLAASYIVYLLKPHSKNFNKRLIKTTKLYFYDEIGQGYGSDGILHDWYRVEWAVPGTTEEKAGWVRSDLVTVQYE